MTVLTLQENALLGSRFVLAYPCTVAQNLADHPPPQAQSTTNVFIKKVATTRFHIVKSPDPWTVTIVRDPINYITF